MRTRQPTSEARLAAIRPHLLYRITLAYDGTDFQGWQLQLGRKTRTVQGAIEQALEPLAGERRVAVFGASRTDAGVHAVGQVASFELPREIPPEELARALNALLPKDVRVLNAEIAPPGFHARKSARSKLYRYVLDIGPVQLPTRRRFAGHVRTALDEARVREAARLYLGRQDFASLQSAGGSVRTTVRTILRSDASFDETGLLYEVEGDGFLRKMVRSLVGGLVAVGCKTKEPSDLAIAMALRDRGAWPAPVAARGLSLVRVAYDF